MLRREEQSHGTWPSGIFRPTEGWRASLPCSCRKSHLERGDPVAASRNIFSSLQDIEVREGWSELYVPGYTVAMEVAYADNGLEAAAEILDQAERTIRRRNMRRLQRLICYKRLDLFVRADRVDLAELTLQDIDRLEHDDAEEARPCWRGYYMAAFSMARHHIRFGDAAHALELLNEAVSKSQEANAARFRLKGLVLQSMALHKSGDSRAAAQPFKQAVALGSSCGFYGSFAEEGRLLAQSVQAIVRETGIGDMSELEVELVARLLSDICAGELSETPHILSSRELEVMQQLAQGYSNKLIARYLGLSESTVKFHLKNIYAKLGVNKRALAVAVARRHGLDKPHGQCHTCSEIDQPRSKDESLAGRRRGSGLCRPRSPIRTSSEPIHFPD